MSIDILSLTCLVYSINVNLHKKLPTQSNKLHLDVCKHIINEIVKLNNMFNLFFYYSDNIIQSIDYTSEYTFDIVN